MPLRPLRPLRPVRPRTTSQASCGFPVHALPPSAPATEPGPATSSTDWRWFAEEARLDRPRGREMLESWDRRRSLNVDRWPLIREEFEDFRHRALYCLTEGDVRSAHRRTEHALGNLRPDDEGPARNWSGDMPFVYVLHRLLEDHERMPLWQDVVHCVTSYPGLLLRRFWREHGLSEGSPEAAWNGSPEMRAFHFRLGKAYYSFFREVHLMTLLRERHGVDLGYHFLLDSEWKADFVSGDVLVELYMENREYKTEDSGRKHKCRQANPERDCVVLTLKEPREFGKPAVFPNADIEAAAKRILSVGGQPIAGHRAFAAS